MKTKIKVSTSRTIDLEGEIVEKRTIFGRKEGLFVGKLAKPIWIELKKKK